MLYTFLLVLLVIDSIVLIAAVLLQAGQGGGMAATFGGVSSSASSFLGTRQAGYLLTKASWWCGGMFLGLAFLLSIASTRSRAPKSVLDQAFPNAPAPVTAPPANANPAVPLQPVPATGAPETGGAPTGTQAAPKKNAEQAPKTETKSPKKP
jgi:preprotein translocase subunit SecG